MIALQSYSGEVLSFGRCFNWLIFSIDRMEKLILKMKRRRKKRRREVGRKRMRMKEKVRKNLLMKMKRMLLQIVTLILNLTMKVKKKLQGMGNRRNTKQMKMNHRMLRKQIQEWKLPNQSFPIHLLVSKELIQRSLLPAGGF